MVIIHSPPFITATTGVHMIISHADAKYLAQRARDLHDDVAVPAEVVILNACCDGALRRIADRAKAHRHCSSRACRRAHRCAGKPRRCNDIVRRLLPDADAPAMIEELYWRVLQRLVDEDEAERRKA
jgi:hypothetical protein